MSSQSLVSGEIRAHPDKPTLPVHQLLEPVKFVPNA